MNLFSNLALYKHLWTLVALTHAFFYVLFESAGEREKGRQTMYNTLERMACVWVRLAISSVV
jgi:hypothetical protein